LQNIYEKNTSNLKIVAGSGKTQIRKIQSYNQSINPYPHPKKRKKQEDLNET